MAASTEQSSLAGPPTPMCVYYCFEGRWVLMGHPAGPWYCNVSWPGSCNDGEVKNVPATPLEEMGIPSSFAESIPENNAAYLYQPGSNVLRLAGGSCERGYYLPTEISLDELSSLAPQVASLINSSQSVSGMSEMRFILPARRIEDRK